MTDLESKLAEIEALAEKATPGPWQRSRFGVIQTHHITRDVWQIPHKQEDIPFIASARTLVPELVAALRLAMRDRDSAIVGAYSWIIVEKNKSVVLRDAAVDGAIKKSNAALLALLEGKP